MKLKLSLVVSACALLAVSGSAHAAIAVLNFSCTGTHQKGKAFPIPDAPNFSLECISRSAISGSGTTCDLITETVFPAGKKTTTPMQTVSSSHGVDVFRAGDTTAHVSFARGTAEITTGFGGEAECKLGGSLTGRPEQQ
jgi:hypothetical protein